jgi:hypothetical protein
MVASAFAASVSRESGVCHPLCQVTHVTHPSCPDAGHRLLVRWCQTPGRRERRLQQRPGVRSPGSFPQNTPGSIQVRIETEGEHGSMQAGCRARKGSIMAGCVGEVMPPVRIFQHRLVHRFIARSSRGCNYCPSSSRTGSACTRRFRGPRSELRRATSSYKWCLIACCSALNGSENDRPAFCFSTKSIIASASSACRRFNLRCGNKRSSGSRARLCSASHNQNREYDAFLG